RRDFQRPALRLYRRARAFRLTSSHSEHHPGPDMEYRRLGTSDIDVSKVCLGTMTWGQQNTEAEGHAQLDRALELGINFIDVAEIYPVPPRGETFGRTEAIIGSWLASRPGVRGKVVIATKVAGANNTLPHVRGGPLLNRRQITEA